MEHATFFFREVGGVLWKDTEEGVVQMGFRRNLDTGGKVALVGVGLLVGCAGERIPPSVSGTRYADRSEIVAGSKGAPTMHDLETSARSLMARMRASSTFAAKCKTVELKRARHPLVVIGGLNNLTTLRIQDRLDALVTTIRSELFETSFIEVKDDEAAERIKRRIVLNADGGLETGDLVQTLGEHDSPDFIVIGDLRRFEDDGIVAHRLHLAVHSLVTGKIAWEGVQTIEKF